MNRRTILRWPLPPAFSLLNYKNYHGGVAGAGKCRRVLHHLTEAQRRESIPKKLRLCFLLALQARKNKMRSDVPDELTMHYGANAMRDGQRRGSRDKGPQSTLVFRRWHYGVQLCGKDPPAPPPAPPDRSLWWIHFRSRRPFSSAVTTAPRRCRSGFAPSNFLITTSDPTLLLSETASAYLNPSPS